VLLKHTVPAITNITDVIAPSSIGVAYLPMLGNPVPQQKHPAEAVEKLEVLADAGSLQD